MNKWKLKIIKPLILVIFLLISFIFWQLSNNVKTIKPGERYKVEYISVVDGDTGWFRVKGKKTKVRFMLIDTPESTKIIEPFGFQATNFTKNLLSKAKVIEFEENLDGNRKDDYGRLLVWVFADGKLVQEELARNGYVKKLFDFGYKYTYKKQIVKANKEAKRMGRGIYSKN